MLPSGVALMLAPVESETLYIQDGPGFWNKPVHGIDFSHLERRELEQALAIKTEVHQSDLIGAGQPLFGLNLTTASKEDVWQSGRVSVTIERDGLLHGFAGWFVAELTKSVLLDTGRDQATTHWMQTYFPIEPMAVSEEERLEVITGVRLRKASNTGMPKPSPKEGYKKMEAF